MPLTMHELPPAETEYLILESEKHVGPGITQRWIHILKPDGVFDEFAIGRGEDHDLLLNDITTSDIHAYLKFEGETWTLEDNDSKYGTTVRMKRCMPITDDYEKAV